jgi:S1-C subfamily serine protease
MEWEIPGGFQPKPEEFSFDVDRALSAVLGLQSTVPEDAFTAQTLGTERAGSGVLIRKDGLVLTIGYLISEAESIWLTSSLGGAVPGHVLGYDQETGFGLVQALGRLSVPAIEMGTRIRVGAGDKVILAAEGGRRHAVAATVVARQEFAGYWEYLLDRAIFTAPAHPFWGGAALIGGDGSLIGIGSLHVQHSNGRELRRDVNMVVPIDLLPPILDDLLTYGRPNRPPRPRSRTRSSSPASPTAGRRARPGSNPATASWRCATNRWRASPRSGAGCGRAAPPAARWCCRSRATRKR